MTRWLLFLPLLGAELGCTVTAVSQADDPRPKNSCSSNSDCDKTYYCSEGICQDPNALIESLLISATPPSDSALAHLTYVTEVTDVPARPKGDLLIFPGPLRVTGSLALPADTCYPTFVSVDADHPILTPPVGTTLPVAVTLSPHERILGLSQQLYYASAAALNPKGGYTFDVQVPSGNYDIYLVPPPNQLTCKVPPQLYRSVSIDSKSSSAVLPLKLLAVSDLTLTVHFPDPGDGPGLKGWIADIVEPVGGNSISTAVVLGEPTRPSADTTTVYYKAELRYSTVGDGRAPQDAATPAGDLLRLRPPPGIVAPAIIFDRSGLGLFDVKEAGVTAFTKYPAAVTVQGQLARHDTGAPITGDVTLVSTSISGIDDGIFASYRANVHVGEDGLFEVMLPPGQYAVQAVPPLPAGDNATSDAVRALTTTWEVPPDPPLQAGKLLELLPIIEITGRSSIQGAQVQAVAAAPPSPLFDEAFGQDPFTPRATSGLVDDSGHFAVQTDPGKFHVSVQAPESLGFAWFVRPGVEVVDKDQDLGSVPSPVPSLLFGQAQVDLGGTPVALGSAGIRAYAYLDKDLAYTRDPKLAVSVIQVAETHADESGAFRLLLPPSLDSK